MGWLILAIFLYFACAVLIVTEIFVPSGGLLSVCALACLAGGVAIFLKIDSAWMGVLIALVEIPVVLAVCFKLFPKTRFGKTVTLVPPERKDGDAVPDTDELAELLGDIGEVLTPLRPVGMADFTGRRVECVAEDGYVDKGKQVKVIKVESTQLTVRVVDES